MQLLDVNVVVAAHRRDHPHHAGVRPWFDRLVDGHEPFTVPTVVWDFFLRLVTHRRVFDVPTPLPEAFAFIDATCAQSHHLLTSPGSRHLTLLRRLCEEADAAGDLVPDAVIAAVALEHGCEVVTLDRDFARFSSVRHLRPPRS
ncbi:MAG: type II toxin-antitoxin system VapC family toxin [Actinomycetota bacterium]|nr:type II toxin-antitoxin system VapC family toxin [Actinomycetota bacterium]